MPNNPFPAERAMIDQRAALHVQYTMMRSVFLFTEHFRHTE